MTLNQTEHPIRMLLHGFTKPFHNKMGVQLSYPDNSEHKVNMQGDEQDMLLLFNQWEVAGKPNLIWWFPRSDVISFGFAA